MSSSTQADNQEPQQKVNKHEISTALIQTSRGLKGKPFNNTLTRKTRSGLSQ